MTGNVYWLNTDAGTLMKLASSALVRDPAGRWCSRHANCCVGDA